MVIQRLGPDDCRLLETAVRQLLLPVDGTDGPANQPHLAQALANPDCYFLLCLVEMAPVGYLGAYRLPAVEHDGYLVYLYDLVVHADHRRRGIASRLISALKQHCRADGVTRIWVGTSVANQAAQRAFESTGATRVSETYLEYVYDLTSRAS